MVDYGHLRERQRGTGGVPMLEILSVILLLSAVALGMIELTEYSSMKDDLPTRLTIAELPVGGMEENEAREALDQVYVTQPVELRYEDQIILLNPAQIGFTANSDSMLAEARKQNSLEHDFWSGFWNYLVQEPVKNVTVPLDASYNERELREFLQDIADRYDTDPGPARYDPVSLTFQPGTPGKRLDIESAMRMIDFALRSPHPEFRRVTLPIVDISAPEENIETLRQAILDLMISRGFSYNGPDTVGSVYIMDLQTGDEVTIQPDIVYSAVSMIKIPIMINLFRQSLTLDQQTAYWLTASILCSENFASNFLIQIAGQQEVGVVDENTQIGTGLNQVSCTAQELGATHTFINAPLYVGVETSTWPVCTPAPAENPYNIRLDINSQTTPRDLGTLLTGIYDCAYHNSGLAAVYPGDITQKECQQMIEVLSGNRIDRLLELGLPPGTKIAHKNGWKEDVTGDAGIVFSPGGDYVIVVFVYEPDVDGSASVGIDKWELIEEISRLTYNYFNQEAPLVARRQPILPYTAIDCVLVGSPDDVNLDDIDANRLDANGIPLPSACYGGIGKCRPFDNWGAGQ